MKTSRTKLKSSLFLLTLALGSFPVLAKPVAQVTVVKGQVFVVTPEGKTKSLKVNDHVEDKSEIMVGEGGDVTLNDYYDATYHMIEGTHLKFFNQSVQLKKGKTWIQSLGSRTPLVLTTANASVNFTKSEFITTFDQGSGKTQVLVVNGEIEATNIFDKLMIVSVTAGRFTVLDPEVNDGIPRGSTKVGLDSLNKALAEFKALPEAMKEAPVPKREIASVAPVAAPVKGAIVFMTNGKVKAARVPASANGKAFTYFQKVAVVKKKLIPESAPIRFFGMNHSAPMVVKPRLPASINSKVAAVLPKKIGSELNIDPDFDASFRNEKATQPKHTKELENLIQDLKSY